MNKSKRSSRVGLSSSLSSCRCEGGGCAYGSLAAAVFCRARPPAYAAKPPSARYERGLLQAYGSLAAAVFCRARPPAYAAKPPSARYERGLFPLLFPSLGPGGAYVVVVSFPVLLFVSMWF